MASSWNYFERNVVVKIYEVKTDFRCEKEHNKGSGQPVARTCFSRLGVSAKSFDVERQMNIFKPTKLKIIGSFLVLVFMLGAFGVGQILAKPLEAKIKADLVRVGYDQEAYPKAFMSIPLQRRMQLCGGMALLQIGLCAFAAYFSTCVIIRMSEMKEIDKFKNQSNKPAHPSSQGSQGDR